MGDNSAQAVITKYMVEQSDVAGIESALASGADPNRPIDVYGTPYSPLAVAVVYVRGNILRILLRNGAAFLDQNEERDTLGRAARNGLLEVVRILLEAGRVDVNSICQGPLPQMTLLMCAAFRGHADIVGILLFAGADLNIKTSGGYTALDFVFMGTTSAVHDDIVLKLMDAGCKAYSTPLMYAASQGRLNLLVELISGCSTIHDIDPSYEKPTALDQACDMDVKEFMLVEIRKREKFTAAALSVMPSNVPEVIRRKIIRLLRRW